MTTAPDSDSARPHLPAGIVGRGQLQSEESAIEEVIELQDYPKPGLGDVRKQELAGYREETRRLVVRAVMGILILQTLVGAGLVLRFGSTWENARDYLTILFPSIVTLAATALGFYFGDEK